MTLTDLVTGEVEEVKLMTFEEGMAKMNEIIAASEEASKSSSNVCKCGREIPVKKTPTGRIAKRQYATCYPCHADAMAQEFAHLSDCGGGDMPSHILNRKMNALRAAGCAY